MYILVYTYFDILLAYLRDLLFKELLSYACAYAIPISSVCICVS